MRTSRCRGCRGDVAVPELAASDRARIAALRVQQPLAAIAAIRQLTGCDLRESKQLMLHLTTEAWPVPFFIVRGGVGGRGLRVSGMQAGQCGLAVIGGQLALAPSGGAEAHSCNPVRDLAGGRPGDSSGAYRSHRARPAGELGRPQSRSSRQSFAHSPPPTVRAPWSRIASRARQSLGRELARRRWGRAGNASCSSEAVSDRRSMGVALRCC